MIRLFYSPRIRVASSAAILRPLTIGSLLSLIGDFSRERIFLNRTHSLSRGVYIASDKTNIEKRDLVILPVPMKMKAFQEASTWLSPVKNLLKMVAGTTGDRFCFRNGHLEIGEDFIWFQNKILKAKSFLRQGGGYSGPIAGQQNSTCRGNCYLMSGQKWDKLIAVIVIHDARLE